MAPYGVNSDAPFSGSERAFKYKVKTGYSLRCIDLWELPFMHRLLGGSNALCTVQSHKNNFSAFS